MTSLRIRILLVLIIFLCGVPLIAAIPTVYRLWIRLTPSHVTYTLLGQLNISSISTSVDPTVVPRQWTGDCNNDQGSAAFKQCFSGDVTKIDLNVRSANCGSIVNATNDPKDAKCININEIRRGCGEDKFPFGVKNCRGRGWLDYAVTAYITSTQVVPLAPIAVTGTFRQGQPLIVSFPPLPDAEKRPPEVSFNVQISSGTPKQTIVLTEKSTSALIQGTEQTLVSRLDLQNGRFSIAVCSPGVTANATRADDPCKTPK